MNHGDICDVCKRAYWRSQCGDSVIEGCSAFCATVPDEDRAALAMLKPGDFGVWPCSECGCVIDGEYKPGCWCSGCSPRVRIRKLETVLREAMAVCAETAANVRLDDRPDVTAQRLDTLVAKIEAALAQSEASRG